MNSRIITDQKLECEIALFDNINFKLESGEIIKDLKLLSNHMED